MQQISCNVPEQIGCLVFAASSFLQQQWLSGIGMGTRCIGEKTAAETAAMTATAEVPTPGRSPKELEELTLRPRAAGLTFVCHGSGL